MFEIDKRNAVVSGRGYKLYPLVGNPAQRVRWLEFGVHSLLTIQKGSSTNDRFEAACEFQKRAFDAGVVGVAPIHDRQSDRLNWAYSTDAYESDLADLVRRRSGKPLDGAAVGAVLLEVADTLLTLKRWLGRTHGQLALSRLLLRTDDPRRLADAGADTGPDLTEFSPCPEPELAPGTEDSSLVLGEGRDLVAIGGLILRLADGLPESKAKDFSAADVPGEGADGAKRWQQFGPQRAAWIKLARGLLTPPPFRDPPTIEALRDRLLILAPRLAVQRSRERERERTQRDLEQIQPSAQARGVEERKRVEDEEEQRRIREAAERARAEEEEKERSRRRARELELAARAREDEERKRVEEEEQQRIRQAEERARAEEEATERARQEAEREERRRERAEQRRQFFERLAGVPWGRIIGVLLLVVAVSMVGVGFWRWKHHPARVALQEAGAAIKVKKWGVAREALERSVREAQSEPKLRALALKQLESLTNFPGISFTNSDRVLVERGRTDLRFYQAETKPPSFHWIWFEVPEGELGRSWQVQAAGVSPNLEIRLDGEKPNRFALAWKGNTGGSNVPLVLGVDGLVQITNFIEVRVQADPQLSIGFVRNPIADSEVGRDAQVTANVVGDPKYFDQPARVAWEVSGPGGALTNGISAIAHWRFSQVDGLYTNTWTVTDGSGRRFTTNLVFSVRQSVEKRTSAAWAEFARLIEANTTTSLAKAKSLIDTNNLLARDRDSLLKALSAPPRLKDASPIKVSRGGKILSQLQLELPEKVGGLRWSVPNTVVAGTGVRLICLTNSIVSSNTFQVEVDASQATNTVKTELVLPLASGLQPTGGLQINIEIVENQALAWYENILSLFENEKYLEARNALKPNTSQDEASLSAEQRLKLKQLRERFERPPEIMSNTFQAGFGAKLDLNNWRPLVNHPLPRFTNWTLRAVRPPAIDTNIVLVNWLGPSNLTIRIGSDVTPSQQVLVRVTGMTNDEIAQATAFLVATQRADTPITDETLNQLEKLTTNALPADLAGKLVEARQALPAKFELKAADGEARLEVDPPNAGHLELRVANWPVSWKALPDWTLADADPAVPWPRGAKFSKTKRGVDFSPERSEAGTTNTVTLKARIAGRESEPIKVDLVTRRNQKPRFLLLSPTNVFDSVYQLHFAAWDPDDPSGRCKEVARVLRDQTIAIVQPPVGSATNYSQQITLDRGTNLVRLIAKDGVWTNEAEFRVVFTPPKPLDGIVPVTWVAMPKGTSEEAGSWSVEKGFWVATNLVTTKDLANIRTKLNVEPPIEFRAEGDTVIITATGSGTVSRMQATANTYLQKVQVALADKLGGWRLTLGSPNQHVRAQEALRPLARPEDILLFTAAPNVCFPGGNELLDTYNVNQITDEHTNTVFRIFVSPPAVNP